MDEDRIEFGVRYIGKGTGESETFAFDVIREVPGSGEWDRYEINQTFRGQTRRTRCAAINIRAWRYEAARAIAAGECKAPEDATPGDEFRVGRMYEWTDRERDRLWRIVDVVGETVTLVCQETGDLKIERPKAQFRKWLSAGHIRWLDATSLSTSAPVPDLVASLRERAERAERELAKERAMHAISQNTIVETTEILRVMATHDVEYREGERAAAALARVLNELHDLRALERRVIADRSPARLVEVGIDVQDPEE